MAAAPRDTRRSPWPAVALAGNPNSGKTSLFNHLTGANQRVGNWPGVTVERKEGVRRTEAGQALVVDLPGIYGFTADTPDQRVARDYLLLEEADVLVAVVDASNLTRHLYLVMQLIEFGVPMVIALNMTDVAVAAGVRIDAAALAQALDVEVIPTRGDLGQGVSELWAAVERRAADRRLPRPVRYESSLDEAVTTIEKAILQTPELLDARPPRWLALSLLIGEESALPARPADDPEHARLLATARAVRREFAEDCEATAEDGVIQARYASAERIAGAIVVESKAVRETPSDRADRVFLHRVWGLPILLAVAVALFQLTFRVGAYPSDWIDLGFGALGAWLGGALPEGPLAALLVDGVLAGVGGVLVFVPQILILFALVSILEDSGYMARAAVLMSRLMRTVGLHGMAFIPMCLGFGCTVPAVMATRTIPSERDRLVTILVAPLMSCSARMPVYALVAGALFGARAGLVIFSLYALGVVLAAATARVLRSRVLRGEDEPFLVELPPYHRPAPKSIAIRTWERGKLFVAKAGTVILAGSIVVWALSAFPWGVEPAGPESYAGRLGQTVEPLVRPLGFGWREAVALISGAVAKETVVSTMGVLYGAGEDAEEGAIGDALTDGHLTPLSGYAFLVFVLIYAPCVAAIGAVRRETASWKWTLVCVGYLTVLAWLAALVIYQGGRLLGLE